MSYKWDNKKPTAQMLGRWQPFHDGHYALFEEIIKKTGQVCIQIRDVQGVDDNPFDFETVKKNIEERLNPKYKNRFKIMLVPNITNISYGRGVGYKIEEVVLPEKIQQISATKIREKLRKEGIEVYILEEQLHINNFNSWIDRISSILGTPLVTFDLLATPAKWKVFRVICVVGSPILCAAIMPTISPGLMID